MKKLVSLTTVILLCCMTLLGGCQSTPASPAATTASPPQTQAPAATTAAQSTEPVVEPDDPWSDMTDDELYALALKEGGDLNVYTISSRMQKTCDEFNKAYAGMNAIASDFKQNEAVSKIEIESQTGNINADILQCKDSAGEIFYDFYPMGYLEVFKPTDIASHISPELTAYGMPFYVGLSFWYYNTDMYPNGAPIDNHWEVIEKDANGNNKYNIVQKNPGSSDTDMTFYANAVLHADEWAAAYEKKYGKPLEYTYDASQTPGVPANNAGYEYMYRMTQCKLTFIDDGDGITEAVATSTSPTLGFCSAGKITNRDDNGYTIAWVTEMDPYLCLQNCNYLYVVKGTKHPATARLFIRFLMGGADGQGKGFSPFTKEGNWSIRDDYTNPNNPFGLDGVKAITSNIEDVYPMFLDCWDFWNYWLDKNYKS